MVAAEKMIGTGENGALFITRMAVAPGREKLAYRQLFCKRPVDIYNEESHHQYY
jgi:hypothetical protein